MEGAKALCTVAMDPAISRTTAPSKGILSLKRPYGDWISAMRYTGTCPEVSTTVDHLQIPLDVVREKPYFCSDRETGIP
jgi:hypothetical protein